MSKITDFDINVVKGFVICKESGEYIFDWMIDSDLNPILLSSYVGALSLFGIDHLNQIDEIIIKGPDTEMIIVNSHHLVIITILEKDFSSKIDFKDEAEELLNLFYKTYKNEIEQAIDTTPFEGFKETLKTHVETFLNSLNK